jgi:type IV pilus assembly protein PilN
MTVNPPVLDLLREKRQQLEQSSMAEVLADRPRLLRQGALIGVVLVGLVAGTSGCVLLRQQYVKTQMGELNKYDSQAVELRQRLGERRARGEKLAATNQRLAEALTNVRTSSALLADLQLRTPEGVQLSSAAARGSSLELKGLAADPMAFKRINALLLELRASPLLEGDKAVLLKVERQKPATVDALLKQPLLVPPVAFTVSAPFATLPPLRHLQVLQQLDSTGMARRLELLQAEGLLQ